MYLSHYGLKLKPFSISPDPRFLWLGERHQEALATLMYGIQENKGFLLLTGEVGTGKTVLINHLIEQIDVDVTVATIPDPGLKLIDFYNILADEFKLGRQVQEKGEFLIHFKKFLNAASGDHQSVLLIIDEAQRLEHELLEEIRVLSNIEFHSRKLINIFLVGQNELRKILMEERNRAFRQRISVNYHLESLSEQETASYIEHRLKAAGASRGFFTADAIREVHAFSQGFPRLINVICDHAMMSGYSAGFTMIDESTVKECTAELTISPDVSPTSLQQLPGAEYSVSAREPETIYSGEAPKNPFINVAFVLAFFVILFGLPLLIFRLPLYTKLSDLTGPKNEIALTNGVVKIEKGLPDKIINYREDSEDTWRDNPPPGKLPGDRSSEDADAALDLSSRKTARIGTDKAPRPEASGDPLKEEKIIENKFLVYFNAGSTAMESRHFETLTEIMGRLSRYPDSKIMIASYTDSHGNYFYNKQLSQLRANIVKSYFVGQGVAESRITATGMGPEDPIADNATREGRSKNRRVEIRLIE